MVSCFLSQKFQNSVYKSKHLRCFNFVGLYYSFKFNTLLYFVLLSYCIFGLFEKITSYCSLYYFFIHLITLNCLPKKQPPEMFCKKRVLENLQNSQESICASFSFLIKLQGKFIKKETIAQVFPVNFAKFLRTPFLIEHLRWLLL